MVVNHLDEIATLHRHATRALKPGGRFLLIAFHPYMIMVGREIVLPRDDGPPAVIRNRRHQIANLLTAGLEAGMRLSGCWESLVTPAWAAAAPGLAPHVGRPIGLGLRWQWFGPPP